MSSTPCSSIVSSSDARAGTVGRKRRTGLKIRKSWSWRCSCQHRQPVPAAPMLCILIISLRQCPGSSVASSHCSTGWFPVGTIILWSGSIDSTMTLNHLGWTICNGGAGAPNLTDRIIIFAGGQHPAGEFGGATGPGLGRHVHAGTATVDAGEAAGPDSTNDFNGAAHYEPSVSNDLPYYAVCYIFKYRDFTVSG